jgi:hypothetical protein
MLDIDMVAEVVLSVRIINLDHQLPTSLHLLLLLCPRDMTTTRKQNWVAGRRQNRVTKSEKFRSSA